MAIFTINDQSVINSHGFRLMNSGARLERYKDNPVVLYQHQMDAPIGVGQNLKIEGDKMTFEPEFDLDDPLAAQVKCKVEKKHLKGCSPGIIIYRVEIITDEAGKEEYQVTDWELCEISIVSVPSNRAAIQLYNDRMEPLERVDLSLMIAQPTNIINMDKKENQTPSLTQEALTELGLNAGATIEEVSQAVVKLGKRTAEAIEALTSMHEAQAEQLVADAITAGKITADKKATFLNLAQKDYQLANDLLASLPARNSLSQMLTPHNQGKDEREGWSYLEWLRNDHKGLLHMSENDPERFQKIKQTTKNV